MGKDRCIYQRDGKDSQEIDTYMSDLFSTEVTERSDEWKESLF